MRARFLTVAVALASMFAAQQAVAKSHKSNTKTSAMNKKSHKKHKKTGAASVVVPTAKAAPAVS